MREMGWTVDVQGLGHHELLDGPDGNDQQWSVRAIRVFELPDGDIEVLAAAAPLAICRAALESMGSR
jgi:hypothetical protein